MKRMTSRRKYLSAVFGLTLVVGGRLLVGQQECLQQFYIGQRLTVDDVVGGVIAGGFDVGQWIVEPGHRHPHQGRLHVYLFGGGRFWGPDSARRRGFQGLGEHRERVGLGINGHSVQVTYEDDAGNPGTSVSDLQTLISDHVVAIVNDSVLDSARASTVQAAKIPVVGANVTEVPFYTNPDFYPEGQTNDTTNIGLVTTLKTAGATNYGDFYCAEAPICAASVPQLRADGKKLGVPMVLANEISATAPNYTAQCVAASQAHVTGIFIGGSSPEEARIGADCARQNYQPIYVTGGEGFGMGPPLPRV